MLAATLLSPPSSCPAFPANDPAQLFPAPSTAVLGIDIDAFAKTSIGAALIPALRADLRVAEALEILDDCGLSLERSYALAAARGPGEGRAVVAQARKLGAPATLACLEAELEARNDGVSPWTAADPSASPCYPSLDFDDGARAWIINDYTLVWARDSFVDPVAAKLDGREPLALPRALQAEFGRLDRSGHMWLAAILDDGDRAALPGAWVPLTTSLTAAIDLSTGLRGIFSLSAVDVATTANLRELVLVGLVELSERLDALGVEHRIRETAGVGIVDGVVAAELVLDAGELADIRKKVGEQVEGRGPL